jgi:Na+/H+ antiporter NhaD/arsenite permease-like protein
MLQRKTAYMSSSNDNRRTLKGPASWMLWAIIGLVVGGVLIRLLPPTYPAPTDNTHHEAVNGETPDQGMLPGQDQPISIATGPDGGPTPVPHTQPSDENESQAGQEAETHEPGASEPSGESGSHESGGSGEAADGAHAPVGPAPNIPLWLLIPFVTLLGSIALMPFINAHFWHQRFPEFAFFLGSLVVAYYLLGFSESGYKHGQTYGQYHMMHALLEFYSFIALVGGLFVVSGGVLIDVKGKGGPLTNTLLLAFGAVIANIVGTTGASMLLIHPFMRMNKGRLKPIHVVFFIFIISNCGGLLTPIGDPPLYLGFLKGIPFTWTLSHLWTDWAFVIGLLLGMFYVADMRIGPAETDEPATGERGVHIAGISGIICLALMIFGVFIDPILKSMNVHAAEGWPIGATFQIGVAAVAYKLAPKHIHEANEFNFFPVKEVGLLFLGIFATMAPALGYLSVHGAGLGLDSATSFYFGTGSLSGVLDNAPTYLNFLQISFGKNEINPETVQTFLSTPKGVEVLAAISTGAVFFGAMTYIGNGPNFMVKAIAESGGLRMPSFFGYMARAIFILLPVLVLHWLVFFVLA